jgi:hypothetical protein
MFKPMGRCRIDLEVGFDATPHRASISFVSRLGGHVPVQMIIDATGEMELNGRSVGRTSVGESLALSIWVDLPSQRVKLIRSGSPDVDVPARVGCENVQRLCIRTGLPRNIGGLKPVAEGSDQPASESIVRVRRVRITPELPIAASTLDTR